MAGIIETSRQQAFSRLGRCQSDDACEDRFVAQLGWLYLIAGIAIIVVGMLGWRAKLPPNGIAGIRTRASMSSDEAFRVANQVAGPPTVAAGVAAFLTGVALLARLGGERAALPVFLVGAAVTVTLVLVGGIRGNRAARQLAQRRTSTAPIGRSEP
jgi:uncharacterized membrane protein